MNLNATQTAWLAARNLTLTTADDGAVCIKPKGANWLYEPYVEVQEYRDAHGSRFSVTRVGASHAFGMTAPIGRTVSTHRTLRDALRALADEL